MKILLIDYDAGTPGLGGDTHTYDLAKAWKKSGEKTLIVTADYAYLRKKNPEAPAFGKIVEEDETPLLWIKTPMAADREKKIVRGALPFYRGIKNAVPILADWKPDVVIASSQHLLGVFAAIRLAKKLDVPFVFEVRRIYPEHLLEVLQYDASHYLVRLFRHTQKSGYGKSSLVVSGYPLLAEHMEGLGGEKDKFSPIPQAIPPSYFKEHKPPQRHLDFIRRYREKGNYIVLAGTDIEVGKELDLLIQAANQAPRDVLFILVGNGMYKSNLKREVKQNNLPNVLFLDGVQPQQLLDIYQEADCVYVGLTPYPSQKYGADTTEILLAMESGVPVLCAADIPQNPVIAADCGMVVSPGDPNALWQAVTKLREMPLEGRQSMGKRGKAYTHENGEMAHQAAVYLDALRKTVTKRKEEE